MTKLHPQSVAEARLIMSQLQPYADVHPDSRMRFDASETTALARGLQLVKRRVIEARYNRIRGLEMMPINSESLRGVKLVSYQEGSWGDDAKIIGDDVTDLPSVSAGRTDVHRRVVTIGASYHYSFMQLQQAARSGMSLNPADGQRVARAISRKVDDVLALGAPEHGITYGALNSGDVATTTAGATLGGTFDSDLAELNALITGLTDSAQDGFGDSPVRVWLPLSSYRQISQNRATDGSGQSVLNAFLASNPMVAQVTPWTRLETAGAGSTKRGVAYFDDLDVLEGHVDALQQFAPERRGLGFQVPAVRFTAGCIIGNPSGMHYRDGL